MMRTPASLALDIVSFRRETCSSVHCCIALQWWASHTSITIRAAFFESTTDKSAHAHAQSSHHAPTIFYLGWGEFVHIPRVFRSDGNVPRDGGRKRESD